jgi:hypothetical protein
MTRTLIASAMCAGLMADAATHPRVTIVNAPPPDPERDARRQLLAAMREARQQEVARRLKADADRLAQLEAGIDPTNGRALSRQQRRHLQRKGMAVK